MIDIKKPFVKGFKYRIYPTVDQIELFNKTFGCVRYVYNRGLADAKREYEYYLAHKDTNPSNVLVKPILTGYEFCNRLITYKADINSLWLNEVNAVSLQQAMFHLGSAFSTFFKSRKGYPAFKNKTSIQSFTLMTTGFRFKENKLYIAKSKEPLNVKWSRELPSVSSSCVISKTPSGKYYISFTCEYTPVKTSGTGQTGIDLGLKDFLVSSDGIKIPNPKHLKNKEKHLKRVQQALSRKQKGSKNRIKARIKVAIAHEKIANTRNDFLHKLSTNLINENQVIGVEKLKVSNMVKNHKLAKSISDVAWSRFCTMLNYKSLASQNCTLVYMDTWYPSSHLCNIDGYLLEHKLKLSDRQWTCPQCGTLHDRDINAAKNILKVTLATVKEYQILPGTAMILLAK